MNVPLKPHVTISTVKCFEGPCDALSLIDYVLEIEMGSCVCQLSSAYKEEGLVGLTISEPWPHCLWACDEAKHHG